MDALARPESNRLEFAGEHRNEWYRDVGRDELARLTGPERARFEAMIVSDGLERQIEI